MLMLVGMILTAICCVHVVVPWPLGDRYGNRLRDYPDASGKWLTEHFGRVDSQPGQVGDNATRSVIPGLGAVIAYTLHGFEGRSRLDKRSDMIHLELVTEPRAYYALIGVGTPSKQFKVELDTGSADFWLKGPGFHEAARHGDVRYDPKASTSAQPVDNLEDITLTYVGDVPGEYTKFKVYTDTVIVDGIRVPDVAVGSASTWSRQSMLDAGFDGHGSLGLGLPSLSKSGQKSLLNELADRHIIPEATFSVRFVNALWVPYMKDRSVLTLGGADPALYEGSFTDLDVTDKEIWLVQADSISVDGKPVVGSALVEIDTGSTDIFGNIEDVRALHRAISVNSVEEDPSEQGMVNFAIPCNSKSTVTVSFKNQPFDISIDELSDEEYEGTDMCKSGIVGLIQGTNRWIFGYVFLRTVYTKFSFPKPPSKIAHVSFAKLKQIQWLPGQGLPGSMVNEGA